MLLDRNMGWRAHRRLFSTAWNEDLGSGYSPLHPATLRERVLQVILGKRCLQALVEMASGEKEIALRFRALGIQLRQLVLVRWALHGPP